MNKKTKFVDLVIRQKEKYEHFVLEIKKNTFFFCTKGV